MQRRSLLLSALPLLAAPRQKLTPLSPQAKTEDWPWFLGPRHNGTSLETRLRSHFPAAGPPLVWEVPKGTGYSSPAVVGDRLVFLHRQGKQEIVACLHAETGEGQWQFAYPTAFEDRYGYNNGPRSSPVIADGRVFVVGAEGKLHCLELTSGKVLWRHDLLQEFKVPQDFFGVASTPLALDGRLIVIVGAPNGPTVVAFDQKTGKQLWGAGKEWGGGYASPIPAVVHGQSRVFVFAGGESRPPTGGLICLNPATGAIDFTYPWRSKSFESVNASCPVIFGNQVFISASYKTGGALLEITPDFKPKLLWTSPEFGLHFNTPIHQDGYLYGFDGRNEPDASLACVDVKTGKVVWRTNPEWMEKFTVGDQPREQQMSTYRGNLLRVDGHFLVLGELGHLLWMDLTPSGHKELSRSWLFAARETWSPPVLSRGLLYVVQHSRDAIKGSTPRLLCYDLRA